jgi:sugar lactone lactonase YvrE
VSSRVLPVRPRGLFLVMAVLAGIAIPAVASAAVPAPTLEHLAGTGVAGYLGDGGPAVGAQLYQPMGVAVDASGNVLVADLSNRIRKIAPDGTITTVAGSGIAGFAGDGGPATDAQLNHPTGVIVDADGSLLIADQHNYRVRRVDSSGTITTVAGSGIPGFGQGDGGPALQATLNLPTTLALDANGGILIAEMGERRIRRVDPDGTISTIAGDGGSGYDGDNKPATGASLTKPTGLAVTTAGDVLIADQGDQRVRRVDTSGTIHTIAGTGVLASTGDGGPATAANLEYPTSLLVDRSRRVLITQGGSHPDVRAIERDGTINTVAGGGTSAPADGLLATTAALSSPTGMVIDHSGGVIVATTGSNQLWTLRPAKASR